VSRLTISIDWGGTELKGTCFGAGVCLRDFRFSSTNLRVIDEANLQRLCLKLTELAQSLRGDTHLWLIGAAGADDQAAAGLLRTTLLHADRLAEGVEIFSDYACNHAACLGGRDGLLSINGTGSVLFGLRGKQSVRSGGWGYLLDEAPSGSYFGRCAVAGVLRHIDGESGYEAFASAWKSRFSELDRRLIIDELYRSQGMQQRLGSFAPVLTDAFSNGSRAAETMINTSITQLVSSLQRLMQQLELTEASASGSGGLWAGWPPFAGLVANACRQQQLAIDWLPRACELSFGPLILHAKTDFASADLLNQLHTGAKQ